MRIQYIDKNGGSSARKNGEEWYGYGVINENTWLKPCFGVLSYSYMDEINVIAAKSQYSRVQYFIPYKEDETKQPDWSRAIPLKSLEICDNLEEAIKAYNEMVTLEVDKLKLKLSVMEKLYIE